MSILDSSAKRFYSEFIRSCTEENQILDEYCAFSCYIQDVFIKSPYVIDCGNFMNVNKAVVDHFEWFRKHHPILFRIAVGILSL